MTTMPPPGDAGDRPGQRDNGLAATHFVALVDVDPRVADDLLDALRTAGVAAYSAPSPLRSRRPVGDMPPRLTHRLWVDGDRREAARDIVRRELEQAGVPSVPDLADDDPSAAPHSVDSAFADLVATFHASPPEGDTPWPEAENVPSGSRPGMPMSRILRPTYEGDRVAPPAEPDLPEWVEASLDEHFVPEPPPPLPRPSIATAWALIGIVAGIGVLTAASFFHVVFDSFYLALAIIAILVGFGSLVYRMRDERDDDPDDGAVV